MPNVGRNEDFRMLEEFACEAISGSDQARPHHQGRGMAPEMRVLEEVMIRASLPTVAAERVAEFRRLSSAQLLTMIRISGSELDRQELLVIHDIAVERLGGGEGPFFEDSLELSREVMLAAVSHHA